jgi:hypothetical protein
MIRSALILSTVLCSALLSFAQSAATASEMALDDFRHYLDVLHIREADERGVRVQSKAQLAQLPPWFPPSVWDEIVASELKVDFAPIEYSYVKSCTSSDEIKALGAMFATPEGQQYAARMTGGIVEKEAQGISPTVARESAVDHDTGLPLKALDRLSASDRAHVKDLFGRNAMDCMSSGFQKANVDVTDARTKAAREVIAAHRDELMAASQKYEAEHPTAGK